MGLYSQGISFEYGLKLGSFNRDSYLKLMHWQAETAQADYAATGMISVVVQDNHPIHPSLIIRACWQQWQSQALDLFQLPKYSSEMNLIVPQWHQLKTHELAGRIFEDEYELALAVIHGVKARAKRGGYTTTRFKFNST